MRRNSIPVGLPYLKTAKTLRRAPGLLSPARRLTGLKALGLFAVCFCSLLIGGFVLPGGAGAAKTTKSQPAPVAANEPIHAANPEPVAKADPAPAPAPLPTASTDSSPPTKPYKLDGAPVVAPKLPTGPAYELAATIDREIDSELAAAKVTASPQADDAEFLRRVSLDLTGAIPSYDRTVKFLMDSDPHKRAALIDELLASPAYGKHFARHWSELLIKRDFDSNKNLKTEPFTNWLAGKFNEGVGWDAIVSEILTTSGNEAEFPATLFYLANQDNMQPSPAKLVGATGNLFMGIQLQCAECHIHPTVEKWSQKDFWGMAAFFGHTISERDKNVNGRPVLGTAMIKEVERKSVGLRDRAAKKAGEKDIKPGGTIAIPDPTDNKKTVGTAQPKFLEGASPTVRSAPYRPTLASWVVSTNNPYFAPAAVNRLWSQMFSRGLVHPVEEMHDSNLPSHPAVLKALSEEFIKSGYDQKFVLKAVCNTRAYQRTSRPTPANADADDKLLARMPVKVLNAHELLDSLVVATGYRESDPPTRRFQRPMVPNPRRVDGPVSLTRFFDTREYDDEMTEFSFGVPQILKLMNTNLTHRTNEVAGRVARNNGDDRRHAIEDLYLTALARRPKPDEMERMLAYVNKKASAQQGYAGVMWALLNSAEFLSNH